jgi:hypothetical protein
MNDNSPVFRNTSQTDITVYENVQNDPLVTYTATDQDSGEFGIVRYSLENNQTGHFAIDPVTVSISALTHATNASFFAMHVIANLIILFLSSFLFSFLLSSHTP